MRFLQLPMMNRFPMIPVAIANLEFELTPAYRWTKVISSLFPFESWIRSGLALLLVLQSCLFGNCCCAETVCCVEQICCSSTSPDSPGEQQNNCSLNGESTQGSGQRRHGCCANSNVSREISQPHAAAMDEQTGSKSCCNLGGLPSHSPSSSTSQIKCCTCHFFPDHPEPATPTISKGLELRVRDSFLAPDAFDSFHSTRLFGVEGLSFRPYTPNASERQSLLCVWRN